MSGQLGSHGRLSIASPGIAAGDPRAVSGGAASSRATAAGGAGERSRGCPCSGASPLCSWPWNSASAKPCPSSASHGRAAAAQRIKAAIGRRSSMPHSALQDRAGSNCATISIDVPSQCPSRCGRAHARAAGSSQPLGRGPALLRKAQGLRQSLLPAGADVAEAELPSARPDGRQTGFALPRRGLSDGSLLPAIGLRPYLAGLDRAPPGGAATGSAGRGDRPRRPRCPLHRPGSTRAAPRSRIAPSPLRTPAFLSSNPSSRT